MMRGYIHSPTTEYCSNIMICIIQSARITQTDFSVVNNNTEQVEPV